MPCPRFHYSPFLFLKDFVWNSYADPREGGLGCQVSGWQAEDVEFHHYELHSSLFLERFLFGTATLTQEKAASEAKFLADKRRMRNFTIMNYSPLFFLKDSCLKQPRWPKRRRSRRPSFWLTSGGCGISPLWITFLSFSWKIFVWNSHTDPREGGLGGQVSGWQAEDAEGAGGAHCSDQQPQVCRGDRQVKTTSNSFRFLSCLN